jgi:peptide-methionine (S)-S-oxide reductase
MLTMKPMLLMIPLLLMTAAADAHAADSKPIQTESATFGAGCFWCVEAVFEEMIGVIHVESGYSGGHVRNPSYREVVGGRTGHAEVARIVFDPSVITYEDLLRVFWHTHDPTTPNRQGADVGPQYRSAVFYHSDVQRKAAEKILAEIEASELWDDPIVTEISPLVNYFAAEDYHQDYYANNPTAPYCTVVIAPKLAKFRREFAHLLKKGADR